MANSLNFHYLGEALPRSFALAGTPLSAATSIWNVIDGEPRGTRIIAFDCKFGQGKGSWRRTVIAIETKASAAMTSAFDSSVQIDEIRNWSVIWRPKTLLFDRGGLMPIAKLRAHLETL